MPLIPCLESQKCLSHFDTIRMWHAQLQNIKLERLPLSFGSCVKRLRCGQPSDIVTPACPGPSSGSHPGGACQEHLLRKASRGHPIEMPEPRQLAPLDVEEQRLYSKLLPGDRAPHPISKGAPRHPAEETHFSCFCP